MVITRWAARAHHLIPQNSGLTRPISIVAPKGTLANPIFPAPTIARFCPGNQLADTVMKALAPVVPAQSERGDRQSARGRRQRSARRGSTGPHGYAVVITADGTIDREATAQARAIS